VNTAVAGCRFGSHRVVSPAGSLPQAAWCLDSTPVPYSNEILCSVEVLNIDSASFKQIAEACSDNARAIGEHIAQTVAERGKQHNAVTGSGGMFVGRVLEIGSDLADRDDIAVGDPIASLVSLTLTPLAITAVRKIDIATGRVWIDGRAILFESATYARLPGDIPLDVALAVLDVAGAPAQVQRLAGPGQTICVIGADGKSGILACVAARDRVGAAGRVVAVTPDARTAGSRLLLEHGYADTVVEADARDALAASAAVTRLLPDLADLVVNCVNVPGTELTSILCTRDEGTVYFFSMSTSFTSAALGAEGVGKDITMIVGNGFAKGHAAVALGTVRNNPPVLTYFTQRYALRAV
jgi:L-erythro-3,5-diaminohexanoate dehydrogenase